MQNIARHVLLDDENVRQILDYHLDIPSFPWNRLTKIDFLDTKISADTWLRILHEASGRLIEAYACVELKALDRKHSRLGPIKMLSLEKLRLRILHPYFHRRFETALLLPALKYLWIEKRVERRMHYWDIAHYTAFLSCYSFLIQVILSDLRQEGHPINISSSSRSGRRTSYTELDSLFRVLPCLQDIRIQCRIYIHLPTIEKLADGRLLPCLRTLEVAAVDPLPFFAMLRMRNILDGTSMIGSQQRSRIEALHVYMPCHDLTTRQAIIDEGRELERFHSIQLRLDFSAPCMCRYCFGN